MADNKWEVFGYNTFRERRYTIYPQHVFDDEKSAREAVKQKLVKIERDQPRFFAGDPDEEGAIQDTVILVHPDSTEEFFNTNHLTC